MNIQGYVSAWRAPNVSYSATQTKNNTAKGSEFGAILNSKSTETVSTETSKKKMSVSYQGVSLQEWAKTDPKYTDPETGISWYVRDSKHPYMLYEDAEKFNQLCQETDEFPLKKFAEMTGIIQQLDEDTTAYIGTNGTAIEGKDGSELFVDTSYMSYDMLMELFNTLSGTGSYFDNKYWMNQMKGLQK